MSNIIIPHSNDITWRTFFTLLRNILNGKAPASHSHAQSDVTGLADALNSKQNALTAGANITIAMVNDTLTISATTYSPAAAAPGKIASASAQGTSTNYAREDHTHGIDIATGDSNGQVKIAGKNVPVKGLGTMAYKGCLVCTQAQYNAATKDSQTIYLITG